MKGKLLKDLSANTLQMIINQVCGLVIFYVLSVFFSKDDFGEINWSLAILLTAFSILSLGIDQLVVKKIAEGISPRNNVVRLFPSCIAYRLSFLFSVMAGSFCFSGFSSPVTAFSWAWQTDDFFCFPI